MRVTYDLKPGSGYLTLYADIADQKNILQRKEEHGCNFCAECEWDALETLIANSELDWIEPCEIGALTDAPILGIRGEQINEPVTAAWGFMDYQVRSFLSDLVTTGKAVFTAGD